LSGVSLYYLTLSSISEPRSKVLILMRNLRKEEETDSVRSAKLFFVYRGSVCLRHLPKYLLSPSVQFLFRPPTLMIESLISPESKGEHSFCSLFCEWCNTGAHLGLHHIPILRRMISMGSFCHN
ncbi:Uncharacterized protein FKW44_019066, partial [Caligus rogercresseyi]